MLVLPSEWPLKTIAVKISFDIDAETATMSKQRSTLVRFRASGEQSSALDADELPYNTWHR